MTWFLLVVLAISFPGESPESIAPGGRYRVIWREATETQSHRLLLFDSRTNQSVVILEFTRWVELRWNESGDALAVTDHDGSDNSDAFVRAMPLEDKLTNLRPLLPVPIRRDLSGNEHGYVEVERWLSSRTVLLRVHGYGTSNPGGFSAEARWGRG